MLVERSFKLLYTVSYCQTLFSLLNKILCILNMLCVLTSLNKLPSETLSFKPVGIFGALEFKQYVIFILRFVSLCEEIIHEL